METNNSKKIVVITGSILAVVFIGVGLWWWLGRTSAPVALIQDPNHPTATTTPTTEKAHIVENGKYYDIQAYYPSATPLPGTKASDAVVTMKGFIQNTIDGFKENGNFAKLTPEDIKIQGLGPDRKYSLEIEYDMYKGARTISYVYTLSSDTLGAHPNTYYRTFTFDTITGESLALDDLFTTGAPYLERVSKQVRADLPHLISSIDQGGTPAEPDTETINAGTQPQEDSFQNFAIEGGMLRIIFPPYQVGPYSIGTVVDPIPLSTFKSILKAEYK